MSAPSERSATPAPVGRLAPSPTGRLHLGHARSFLLAWALARSRGGRVLLRLEDLDRGRVKPDLIEACIEDLRWLGLDWDGPALLQSEGEAGLREALARLVDGGEAYPCVCTRREIELAVSAPHPGEEGPRYPGTCRGRFRDLFEAERWSGRRAAWRFAVPDGPIELRDELRGRFVIDVASEQGDFPLTSRDG
jgi:glutamyl-tRNA synthetase